MIRLALLVLELVTSAPSISPQSPVAGPPRLVVVLIVDQMRADYLARFRSQFDGGLAWLVENGVVFSDAHHDHAATSTSPGHATLATGFFPSRHGIVGNDYCNRQTGRPAYSFADSTSEILGYPDAAGRSPRNLLRDGLADWVRAESPASRIFAVAIKDRAAIPLGGRRPDGAYWYQSTTGNFVTSSYYRTDYPAWVAAFNASDRAERYYGGAWRKLLPDSAYRLSREDDFAAESDSMSRTFPHRFAVGVRGPDRQYYAQLPETPFGDELTLAFAAELLIEESLGRDEHPDLLFIGLSSADYIGHAYGPYSQEVQDYYLRLDQMLADFFARLGQTVPPGETLIVLSADHGVMVMPEQLSRSGVEAGRTDPRPIRADVRRLLETAVELGDVDVVPRLREASGWCFDFGNASVSEARKAALRRRLADSMQARGDLEVVYTYDELESGSGHGALFEKFIHSFHPDRSGDLVYAPREHYLVTTIATRTSHGSPYEYDTHVPLVFAGAMLRPKRVDGIVRTVDLAPTLATLLGIPTPADLDGRDLGLAGDRSTAR